MPLTLRPECRVTYSRKALGRSGQAVLVLPRRRHELGSMRRTNFFRRYGAGSPVPALLGTLQGFTYWHYRGRVYRENEGLTLNAVHSRLDERFAAPTDENNRADTATSGW